MSSPVISREIKLSSTAEREFRKILLDEMGIIIREDEVPHIMIRRREPLPIVEQVENHTPLLGNEPPSRKI